MSQKMKKIWYQIFDLALYHIIARFVLVVLPNRWNPENMDPIGEGRPRQWDNVTNGFRKATTVLSSIFELFAGEKISHWNDSVTNMRINEN